MARTDMSTTSMFDLPEHVLRKRHSFKWSRFGLNILPAFVAEMDFPVAEPIQRAVQRFVDGGDYGYPMRNGGKADAAVAAAFANRMKDRFDWDIDPGLVLMLADVEQGVYASILAFSEPGDRIVVQQPSYPPLREAVHTTGRRLVPLPMRDDGFRYACDPAEIADLVDQHAKIFVLCNPQNPTGRVFTRGELMSMARFAINNGMIIVSDEIHSEIVYPGHTHIPIASLDPAVAERTITITSPTKSFNIPALRCAVLHFGSAELRDRFHRRMPARLMGDPNAICVDATVAAWNSSQLWLEGIMGHLHWARDRLISRLHDELPQIRCHAPEATYLAWLDCRRLNFETSAFEFFHDHAHVALGAGETFDPNSDRFVRISFATSMPILDSLIDRMSAAVEQRYPRRPHNTALDARHDRIEK